MYTLKHKKSSDGKPVVFDADENLLNLIRQQILKCSEGELDFPDGYIELRQGSLKSLKDIWAPKGAKKIIKQKFNGRFKSLIDNFFALILERDQYRIDYVRKIILVTIWLEIYNAQRYKNSTGSTGGHQEYFFSNNS